ncbi:glycosyltransferase family 4 protein [Silicimonas algicola]|uniref:glycosyltransferase family 4 protein n=1 Tax=Silicimonas algicola TaxID=1826607 RepID=UPI000D6B6DAD|nr:glycosyltransferase family 4 protein [Silicimonas algicola]
MFQGRKIVVFSIVTDAFGGFGGIAQYNRDFLQALAASRQVERITVLPRFGNVPGTDPVPKVEQLPAVHGRIAYALQSLVNLRRVGHVDLIFCGHVFMMPVAVLLARLAGAALWLQVHGIDAWQRPSRLLRWSVRQADLVTAVSRHTRRRFLSWAEIAPEKVKVLPNTINDKFCPGPKSTALLDRYGLRGKKVLLTISRLAASERYKGHDRVIQAMSGLLAEHPETRYLIAGDGDDRPRLEELARRNGVAEHVIFAGQVPEEELVDQFRLADVFVMPSIGEGFGIVFLQAAACGLQVIAGNRDGSVDALAEGVLGRLIDPLDENALADALQDALNAPNLPSPEAVRRLCPERFGEAVSSLVQHVCLKSDANDIHCQT